MAVRRTLNIPTTLYFHRNYRTFWMYILFLHEWSFLWRVPVPDDPSLQTWLPVWDYQWYFKNEVARQKRMKTWFRRVKHLTRCRLHGVYPRYVSTISKLISSIISASSRWKASRKCLKSVSKGLRQFKKKISKIFKCRCFKEQNSRINFPRLPWSDSRILGQSGCRVRRFLRNGLRNLRTQTTVHVLF